MGAKYQGVSLPVADWPEHDRELWRRALLPGDIFDDEVSIAASWSAAYRRMIEQSYGRWLSWLEKRGQLDRTCMPGQHITQSLFSEFLHETAQSRAPYTVTILAGRVKAILSVIAPHGDWGWLGTIYRNLKRAQVPVREKHTRLVEAAALFELGLQLLRDAEQQLSANRHATLLQARDGLIIALLAARPLRIRNLTAIEIGRHLTRDGDLYRLAFTQEETKVGRRIDVCCPAELTPYIDRYLEFYRPELIARGKKSPDNPSLWINLSGGTMGEGAIRRQIENRTKEAFGRPINPHLFRDCAATSIAVHDPEHVRIASVILGHARVSTTDKHYNQAQMLSASRTYNREIVSLRNKAKSWRSRKAQQG